MSVQIEDIYPLSPLQQGMLFHSVYEPVSGAYFQQCTFRLEGALSPAAFRAAWQQVIDRHPALRTVFLWQDLDTPLQVVHRAATLPFEEFDWRDLPPAHQAARLESYLRQDRQRGFDLATAPLMRIALISLGENAHQCVLSNHHLLLDGWSVSALLGEVLALYQGQLRKQPMRLPAPRPYRDYIAWLQRQNHAEAEAFWRATLGGFANPTPFGVDRPLLGGDVPASYGECRIRMSSLATQSLQEAAKRHKLTMNTIVQGAWAIVLSRYTGERDVVFGTPVSTRPPELLGSDRMIGLFINTIPVRIQVEPTTPVATWLHAIQERQIEARHYSYSPLSQVQAWSDVPRGTPLFESLFVFENYPTTNRDGGPEPHLTDMRFVEQTNYPLTLEAILIPDLAMLAFYDRRRFHEASVDRMLAHLVSIMEQMSVDIEQPLVALATLTAEERAQIEAWNATSKDLHRPGNMLEFFVQQAAATPDATALIAGEQRISYGRLNERANHVARYLRQLGVGPETLVGVCMTRSADLIVALLGVLKAGGGYVPLDPAYPHDRLAFMLADSAAPVLLTEEALAGMFADYAGRTVRLDSHWATIEAEPGLDVELLNEPHHLAYLIYTSGSTGTPKGVAITHLNAATFIQWARTIVTPADLAGVLASTSVCFDLSIFEIFVPLSWGGTVILADNALHLPTLPAAAEVSLINTVPSAITELVKARAVPASVHTINLAGEPLKRALVDQIYQHTAAERVLNLYGPSEDTTYSTYAPVEPAVAAAPTIGRPIANTEALILDHDFQLAPIGVPGELYLSGDGLARGYFKRPALTAERFLPHPWAKAPGARLYRTGDLARYQPDGSIEHLGRSDHQVKIRGYRIELGEIEAALQRHPLVQTAVVVARSDGDGPLRLIAYLEQRGDTAAPAELRTFLQQTLPDYMLPARFIWMDALPLTPNGKVNRAALPAPDQSRADVGEAFAASTTLEEQTLAAIWEQVFGRSPVGVHDDFFDLGGDSIISLQIVARANQAGLRITPKQLFEQRTIAKLAAVATSATASVVDQNAVQGDVPLTPIQAWFFSQDRSDPHHYNQAALLSVPRDFDRAAFSQALQVVVAHHDALRLRFSRTEAGWRQSHQETVEPVGLEVIDLSAVAPELQAAELAARAGDIQGQLVLEDAPLLRAAFFDLGAAGARLLLVIHHLVVDGVSWRIILGDLVQAYMQLTRQIPVALAPKTNSFQQWAAQLRAYASAISAEERGWWQDQAARQVRSLPVDSAGANTVASIQTVSLTFDSEATAVLLRRVPAIYRTQIQVALLTALSGVLQAWIGGEGLLIDMEAHGRGDIGGDLDISRTVGWFTALYPLWIDQIDLSDPVGSLQLVKERLLQVPQNGVGYGVLRYLGADAQLRDQLAAAAPAQVTFNYLGQLGQDMPADAPFGWADESFGPVHSPRSLRTHLLDVGGSIIDDQLRIDWAYSENMHRRETIEQLAEQFAAAVHAIINHCRAAQSAVFTPSDFPLANLGQTQLNLLAARYPDLEDVYPPTPAQQGMLFHSLYSPDSAVYFTQFSWVFEGDLDAAMFRQCWQDMLDEHAILRTSFEWEGLDHAFQIIQRSVQMPWEELDWRGLDADGQAERVRAYLAADQARGFNLRTPPLMRVALIRLEDQRYQLVWSQHHILLDGWCTTLLLREVFIRYMARRSGDSQQLALLSPSRPYRDYVAWLKRQDLGRAEAYWREQLRGFQATTPLMGLPASDERAIKYTITKRELSADATARLQQWPRRHRVTLNTLVQGLWACILAAHSQQADVVFGCTVAGRPSDLQGADTMIGLFINTLPLRIAVAADMPLALWLQRLQNSIMTMNEYEYTPLAQVQRWSVLPARQPLFESVVVFENIPTLDPGQAAAYGLRISGIESSIQNNFPLTLRAAPEAAFGLHMLYDEARFSPAIIGLVLDQLEAMIAGVLNGEIERVGQLIELAQSLHNAYLRRQGESSAAAQVEKLKTIRRKAITSPIRDTEE